MSENKLLVMDLGGSYARALARRLRGCGIYCEVEPAARSARDIMAQSPKGLVFCGEGEAVDPALISLGLPVLSIGPAACAMVRALGGEAAGAAAREEVVPLTMTPCTLLSDVPDCERYFDLLSGLTLPEGFVPLAGSALAPAIFGCEEKRLYGMQFTVEPNDPEGLQILTNFAALCGMAEDWRMEAFLDAECERIRAKAGGGTALMAISGGVDSSVCAAMMHRAIGQNMYCLYVDTGLMRQGDSEMIERIFAQDMGLHLIRVDATERFLSCLKGVTDPMEKWRVTDALFSEIFAEEAEKLGRVDFLVQGTTYSDLLDSGLSLASHGEEAGVIEPVRRLFKDEVRRLGDCLGLPEEITQRQSFPGSGLARRILGEATGEKLAMLRSADAIYCEELHLCGQDKRIGSFFAVLQESASTGEHACRYIVLLRAVNRTGARYVPSRLPYDLIERISERIMAEVPGVQRVVFDTTVTSRDGIEPEPS